MAGSAIVLYYPPSPGSRWSHLGPPMTFVGPSAPGTAIVEVAAVKDAAHFASEASAKAYLAARVASKPYGTQWCTITEGVTVLP